MKRSDALQALAALALAIVLPGQVAFGQSSSVTTVVERRIEAADVAAGAELYQSVLEFAPGDWTPVHSHGGPSYDTVLEGEVTLRVDGGERTFRAGEGWVDEPGVLHQVGNQGTSDARLVAGIVTGKGVPPSTIVEPQDGEGAPPEPTTLAFFKLNVFGLTGPIDVVQQLIELEPNAAVPMHTQPGPTIVGVVDGSVVLATEGKTRDRPTGKSWGGQADLAYSFAATDSMARIVTTTLVPRGAVVSLPTQPTAAEPAAVPFAGGLVPGVE